MTNSQASTLKLNHLMISKGRQRQGSLRNEAQVGQIPAQGVEAVGGVAEVKGLLTTPQLHWMVRRRNKGMPCGEADYFCTLAQAFGQLTEGFPHLPGVIHTTP